MRPSNTTGMRYAEQAGNTIEAAFRKFDRENPQVYKLFCQYAFYMLRKKKMDKISSKLIINRIRWEVYVETKTEDPYRINDAFTAHYARKFIKEYPHLKKYFELRRIRNPETIEDPVQSTINFVN